ncbi:uncharacterized protein LOC141900400 [Tubulanus polymorphus]|uniref:uncharacterized protein LOC141900400 n=1 Tax=Tubulanus polymorphus TaxID=672921 RepID=UPI003DA4AE78
MKYQPYITLYTYRTYAPLSKQARHESDDAEEFGWNELHKIDQSCKLPVNLSCHSILAVKNRIFVFGGLTDSNLYAIEEHRRKSRRKEPKMNGPQASNRFYEFSLRRNDGKKHVSFGEYPWQRMLDMPQPRCMAGTVKLGKRIYIIGGYSTDASCSVENSVDSYNINKRQWKHEFTINGQDYREVDCCLIEVPITNGESVNDKSTGTGRWVMW